MLYLLSLVSSLCQVSNTPEAIHLHKGTRSGLQDYYLVWWACISDFPSLVVFCFTSFEGKAGNREVYSLTWGRLKCSLARLTSLDQESIVRVKTRQKKTRSENAFQAVPIVRLPATLTAWTDICHTHADWQEWVSTLRLTRQTDGTHALMERMHATSPGCDLNYLMKHCNLSGTWRDVAVAWNSTAKHDLRHRPRHRFRLTQGPSQRQHCSYPELIRRLR